MRQQAIQIKKQQVNRAKQNKEVDMKNLLRVNNGQYKDTSRQCYTKMTKDCSIL